MSVFGLIAWVLAHQAAISGLIASGLQIVGGASVAANLVKAPKNVGGALDTAHSVLSAAALDFSKFTKANTRNGVN